MSSLLGPSRYASCALSRRPCQRLTQARLCCAQAVHADEASSHTAAAVSPVFALRDILSVPSYPHNAVAPYPFSPSPLPLSDLPSTPLASLALTHRRSLDAARTRDFLRATLRKMERLTWSNGGQVPVMPARAWPWRLGWAGRRSGSGGSGSGSGSGSDGDERATAPPSHHWILSNQMVSGVAELSLPAALLDTRPHAPRDKAADDASSCSSSSGAEGDDLHAVPTGELPLLAFYLRITAPIKDHQAIRFQVNDKGLFLEGSMRRKRWEALGRAVERLEREFGRGAGQTREK